MSNQSILFGSDPSSSGAAPSSKGYYISYYPASGSNYWSTSSATYADLTVSGTTPNPTVIVNSNFVTIGKTSTGLAGITFTAPSTGLLRVTANIAAETSDGAQTTGWRLYDNATSTLLDIYSFVNPTSLGQDSFPMTMMGYLNVTSGTSYTPVIQGKTNGAIAIGSVGSGDMCLCMKLEYIG